MLYNKNVMVSDKKIALIAHDNKKRDLLEWAKYNPDLLAVGAKIISNEIDFLIFFWDPLEPQPHDPDVRALLWVAVVWNISIACNRASADLMISSPPLMDGEYHGLVPDYDEYGIFKIDWGERTGLDWTGLAGHSRNRCYRAA
jgi:methylglyoxal synthase